MAYGLRYKAGFVDVNNCEWSVLILKKDYTGGALIRPLGGSPVVKCDDGDYIRGTSLEFTLEAVVDCELQELYTTDNKMFRVDVMRNGVLFWTGFMLPELYTESYIAPPYNVNLSATDGVGILKDVDFDMSSPKTTLADVIHFCCKKTELNLQYLYVSSLKETRQSGKLMYAEVSVDTKTFEGCSCYETLEKILSSTDAYMSQIDGQWFIGRYGDLGGEILQYDALTKVVTSSQVPNPITMGSVANEEIYPIGEMSLEVVPAKKSVKFVTGYGSYPSLLKNYDFKNGLDKWTTPTGEENVPPVSVFSYENEYEAVLLPSGTVYQTGKKYVEGYIAQSCRVDSTNISVVVGFNCAIGNSRDKIDIQGKKICLLVSLVGDDSVTYYLTREGWGKTEKEIEIQLEPSDYKYLKELGIDAAGIWHENLEEFKLVADGFPVSGNVTIKIRNGCSILFTSIGQLNGANVFIKNVSLAAYVESGVEMNVGLCASASASASDVPVPIIDAPVGENMQGAFFNTLWIGQNPTEFWLCNGINKSSFLDTTIKSVCSRLCKSRIKLSGTIAGRFPGINLLYDKYSGRKFFMQSYSYNLLDCEIECTLMEVTVAAEGGVGEIVIENVRGSEKGESRISAKGEYRIYELVGDVITKNAKMIRQLLSANEEDVIEGAFVEIDSANTEKSKKMTLKNLVDWFLKKIFPVLEGENKFKGNQSVTGDVTSSGKIEARTVKGEDVNAKNLKVTDQILLNSVRVTAVDDVVEFSNNTENGVEIKTKRGRFRHVVAQEVSSEDFVSGLLGVGHRLFNGVLEVNEIIVRKVMHVFEIIIQKTSSVNGSTLTTPGGGIKIAQLEELETGYKCFFNNDEGTIPNPYIVGDQLLHQVFTGKGIGRYWRLVTEVGDDYFILSKTDCEAGSGIPAVNDEVIQFGNRTDRSRQNATLTTSYGSNAPYTACYSGVNNYSLEGKEIVRQGNLEGIVDPDFGQLIGTGFYGQNVFLKGVFKLLSGKTVDQAISDSKQESIQAAHGIVDNLQIGGVNILNETNFISNTANYFSTEGFVDTLNKNRGKYITFSLDIDVKQNNRRIVFEMHCTTSIGDRWIGISFFETNYKGRYNSVLPVEDVEYITVNSIYIINQTGFEENTFGYPKIEIGNKATAWSPSLADQQAQTELIAQSKAELARLQAEAYADGVVTEAEQNAIDEAQRRLDALQIGGVNLFPISRLNTITYRGSSTKVGTGYETIFKCRTAGSWGILPVSIPTPLIPINSDFVISFDIRDTDDFGFEITGTSDTPTIIGLVKFSNPTGEWIRFSKVYNSGSRGDIGGINLWGIGDITRIKIEKGNKVTDPSPAPEDVQAEIDAAKNTADNAQQSVMRVTEQVTELSAETGRINLSVSQVQEKVNNTKIGTVNIFNNSGNFESEIKNWHDNGGGIVVDSAIKYNGYNTIKTSVGIGIGGDWYNLENGVEYCYSVMVKADANFAGGISTPLHWWAGKDNQHQGKIEVLEVIQHGNANEWTLLYIVFKLTYDADSFKPFIYWGNHVANFNIAFLCLTKGNKPMQAWSPSLQDQEDLFNKAKQEAISAAATDATNKSEVAKNTAIGTASTDATNKANNAKNEANNYTDQLTESKKFTTIDARGLDENTYYPVTLKLNSAYRATIKVEATLDSSCKPSWATHGAGFALKCTWSVNGIGWGTIYEDRVVDSATYRYADGWPAGSIGQMSESSFEYIYVRGGGIYHFTTTTVAEITLRTSTFTVYDETINPQSTVVPPEVTGATKTELRSEITVLTGQINAKVSQTIYDSEKQVINSSLSQLQINYNSISQTVSNVNNKLDEIEAAGFITTAEGNTLFARKDNIISVINQSPESVKIRANNISLEGLVTMNGYVQVTEAGKLIAVDGEFSGKITATKGFIGGFTIGTDYIENIGLKLSRGIISYEKSTDQKSFFGISNEYEYRAGTSLYIENNTPSTMNHTHCCAYFKRGNKHLSIGGDSWMIYTGGNVILDGELRVSGPKYFTNLRKISNTSGWDRMLVNLSTGEVAYG